MYNKQINTFPIKKMLAPTMKLVALRILLTLFAFCTALPTGIGQITEELVQQELSKRDLNDALVRQKLLERGIDVDNINIDNPEEIFRLEKALSEVIAEIEREEKQAEASEDQKTTETNELTEADQNLLAQSSEDISASMEDGASLEEAVSEELNEANLGNIPDASTYGQEIFRSQKLKLYRQSEDVKPPGTYVLGVGDVIAISIWGYSEEDLVFEINKEGYIKPDRIPRINLKGLRLDDARELLKRRFSNYYRFDDNQFEVTLNYGRTINVNIVGEVHHYGTFNIPAINSAFNALVAAGGPNDVGSVRNIKLIRLGQERRDIDVYKYLQDPNYEVDLYLEERDVIHVPIAERIVSIGGAVIRPHRYELKSDEDLVELLEFCGGLKANASLRNIQIKRYEDDVEKIIDVNLNDVLNSNTDVKLYNGDVVYVSQIGLSFDNYVQLEGAVELPGQYALEEETTIQDLLDKSHLLTNALLDVAYLKRLNPDGKTYSYYRINLVNVLNDASSPDNLVLRAKDELRIYDKSQFVDQELFTVRGAVRNPADITYDFSKQLRLSDAIFLAGGTKKYATDFAYLKRQDQEQVDKIRYIRVDLNKALMNPENPENIEILPGDELVVYSQKQFVDNKTISIGGAVRNPGEYAFDESLKIQDLIAMSGGLKFNASRKRVDIYRLAFEDESKTKTLAANLILDENNIPMNGAFNLLPFDRIVIREAPEFETIKTIDIQGEVKYPGSYALVSDNETVASVIQRAGGPTPEAFLEGGNIFRTENDLGYISVNLDYALRNNASRHNIIMKPNDRIVVPKKRDLVSIVGATRASEVYDEVLAEQRQINVPYVSGKNAMYYIKEYAGGINENADKSKITVSYPNGSVKSTGRFLFWRKYPPVEKGSVIRVGRKKVEPEELKVEKEPFDWGGFFRDTIAGVSAILTIIVLAQRIE